MSNLTINDFLDNFVENFLSVIEKKILKMSLTQVFEGHQAALCRLKQLLSLTDTLMHVSNRNFLFFDLLKYGSKALKKIE